MYTRFIFTMKLSLFLGCLVFAVLLSLLGYGLLQYFFGCTPKVSQDEEHGLTLFRGLSPSADVFSLDNSFDLLDRRKQPLFAHQDLLNVNSETVFGMDSSNATHSPNLLLPRQSVEPQFDVEATVLGRIARQLTKDGRVDKARKLYERALLMNAERPDLLSEYADFVEQTSRDIRLADHLYTKALAIDANLERALQAHDRLGPLVAEIDRKMFTSLDAKRDLLLSLAAQTGTNAAVINAKHENYFLHIFHTTAIEGNTLSLPEARYILETGRAVGGKSIIEHQEILGLDAALQFISTSLLRRRGHIELDDILDIHYRVMAYVDPFNAGRLRTNQVYIASYTPPPAERLPGLLAEFVQWLNSPAALQLHPVELAAIAHYKLVIIHPFKDGNGRTSRLLLNLILLHSGYPPVVVRLDDRDDYYRSLRTANGGDIRPFIRFIANCTDTTMSWFMDSINRIIKTGSHRLPIDVEFSNNIPEGSQTVTVEADKAEVAETETETDNSPSPIILSDAHSPSKPPSTTGNEAGTTAEKDTETDFSDQQTCLT